MLAVPTLNRLDRLTEMLHSVAASTRIPDRVLLVNNGHQVTDAFRAQWSRSFELDVFTPVLNLGVAGSVNYALRNTPDGWWWGHCNDDVELEPNCLERLAKSSEDHPDVLMHIPDHGEGSAFTLFLMDAPRAVREVGFFDEAYFPAYCEDCEYGYRMNLLGMKRRIVKDAAYVHHTSSTFKAYSAERQKQHHDQFRANHAYYLDKWGGPVDHEVFTIPFNGARGHARDRANQWGSSAG